MLVVAVVPFLAACGGGSDRLTREELISRAEAICTKYEQKLAALAEPKSIADVETLAEQAKPIVEDGVEELGDLEPPKELEADYDRWIALNRDSVKSIDDLKEAAAAGDEAGVQNILQKTNAREQEADEVARNIGLDQCAND